MYEKRGVIMQDIISLTFITSVVSCISTYVDKHLMNLGISRKDYFYYMCFSMIPFSFVMVIIEIILGQFKFEFAIIPIIALVFAMIVRYFKQISLAGMGQKLEPFENLSYMSLGIILAYIVDVLMGTRDFSFLCVIFIFIILVGVFNLSNAKLRLKKLKKDLIIRIIGEVALGFIANVMLRYWSNAFYIFALNTLLTIIFSKNYSIKYHKKHKKIIKWVFIQQSFGFFYIYLYNYLSSISVTTSNLVRPITIILSFICAFFIKEIKRKPKFKDMISIIFIVLGVVLIN